MKKFPAWWGKKAIFVAEKLIEHGYDLCGIKDEFCIQEEHNYKCCGWILCYAYGSIGIDAIYRDFLMSKDLHIEDLDPEEEMKELKKLIRKASKEFDTKNKEFKQLKIDFSLCIKFD